MNEFPERTPRVLTLADSLADLAGEARPGDAPKPLDDPRLQELFMSAITGAMAWGAQGVNRPPVGHWLCAAWDMGAETARAAAPAPEVQPLTDEQIELLWPTAFVMPRGQRKRLISFARAIERALGIEATGQEGGA